MSSRLGGFLTADEPMKDGFDWNYSNVKLLPETATV